MFGFQSAIHCQASGLFLIRSVAISLEKVEISFTLGHNMAISIVLCQCHNIKYHLPFGVGLAYCFCLKDGLCCYLQAYNHDIVLVD